MVLQHPEIAQRDDEQDHVKTARKRQDGLRNFDVYFHSVC